MNNTAMTKAVMCIDLFFSEGSAEAFGKPKEPKRDRPPLSSFGLFGRVQGRSSCAGCRDGKSRAGQGLQALPNEVMLASLRIGYYLPHLWVRE